MDTKIIEQLEAVFGQEIDPAGCDLGTLETTIKQGLELSGKGLLQRLVERSDMIWTRPFSSAVLALRISLLNERRQQLWLQKPLAA